MTQSPDAGATPTRAGLSCDFQLHQLAPDKLQATLSAHGSATPFADVIRQWRNDKAFRLFWSTSLREVPFGAYCWEVPPLTRDVLGRPFECVFVESPALARTAADPGPFAAHFHGAPGCEAVVFENLGRDAALVAPCPHGDLNSGTHLADFARQAPLSQVDALWHLVAQALETRLGDAPVWLSTAGLGVYWLHVRLDSQPKYYRHRPYADARYWRTR